MASNFDQDSGFNKNPKRDNGGVWLAVAAVAVVAAFAFYGVTQTATDPMVTDEATMAPSDSAVDMSVPPTIEPAEGDSFTHQEPAVPPENGGSAMGDTPAASTPETPAASVAPHAVPPSYATEEDCKAASNAPCHYVTCDSVPEGKQPDEVCGPDFKKGWQPLAAAAPDKTTVPEQVNPPLTGQGDAPVDKPAMTGQ